MKEELKEEGNMEEVVGMEVEMVMVTEVEAIKVEIKVDMTEAEMMEVEIKEGEMKEEVNFKTGKFKVETSFQHPAEYYKHEKTLKYIMERHKHGVPQKSYNSGLCWYSAMCFAGFFNKQMREFIKYYSKDKLLNNLIDICLDDPNAAEKIKTTLILFIQNWR